MANGGTRASEPSGCRSPTSSSTRRGISCAHRRLSPGDSSKRVGPPLRRAPTDEGTHRKGSEAGDLDWHSEELGSIGDTVEIAQVLHDGHPASKSSVCAGRSPLDVSSMLIESIPTTAAFAVAMTRAASAGRYGCCRDEYAGVRQCRDQLHGCFAGEAFGASGPVVTRHALRRSTF
jgi:hypothetical protein